MKEPGPHQGLELARISTRGLDHRGADWDRIRVGRNHSLRASRTDSPIPRDSGVTIGSRNVTRLRKIAFRKASWIRIARVWIPPTDPPRASTAATVRPQSLTAD